MALRGVFLDHVASDQLDSATLEWPRAEDVWIAVEFIIANDPEVGRPMNEAGTVRSLTWEGALSAGLPTLTVIYVFDRTDITVRSMRWANAKTFRHGRA